MAEAVPALQTARTMNSRALSWSQRVWLLSLGSLLPAGALAAEDAPRLARLSLSGAPRIVRASRETEKKRVTWRAPTEVRVIVEAGVGVGLAAALGVFGGLGGASVCAVTDLVRRQEIDCLRPALWSAGAGAAVGYPIGVWMFGEALGGDGYLWAGMLGTALGLGLGFGPPVIRKLQPIPVLLGLAGGLMGYEFSQAREPPRKDATAPRVLPSLAFSDQGARLGLSGSF